MSAFINKDCALSPIDPAQSSVDRFSKPYMFSSQLPALQRRLFTSNCVFVDSELKTHYATEVVIPAYTSDGRGINVCFKLLAAYNQPVQLTLDTQGVAAEALRKNFIRTLSILASLKKTWEVLLDFHFTLVIDDDRFFVKDARSAGLPLVIALLNILRLSKGLMPVVNVVGTGILRMDGSFDASSNEAQKRAAVKLRYPGKLFLDASNCSDVFDLDARLQNY